jgi:hypothetical protein
MAMHVWPRRAHCATEPGTNREVDAARVLDALDTEPTAVQRPDTTLDGATMENLLFEFLTTRA